MTSHQDFTDDALFSGKLHCLQRAEGYRFSVDAVLLAHFISPKKDEKILDLCAGNGVVSLILAYRRHDISLSLLEVQPRLAELARKNISMNGFGDRMKVFAGDLNLIKTLMEPGRFDWVVCNPPYRKIQTGRINPDKEQAVARHEISADINGVVRAVAYALRTRGRAAFVYPASRLTALIAALNIEGVEPKRLRMVYSYPGSDAKLALVEAMKNGGDELVVLPPFFIYDRPGGEYTSEMEECYQS